MFDFILPILIFVLLWLLSMWLLKKKQIRSGLRIMTHKEIKYVSFIILIFGIIGFCEFIWHCIDDFYMQDGTVKIEAIKESGESTFKQLNFSDYSFVTGIKGDLTYKTQSFFEQVILFDHAGKNIISVTIYLIIGILIFRSLSSISETNSFSSTISKTFKQVAILIISLPLINSFFERLLLDKIILAGTNDMFSLNQKSELFEIVPGLLILMFAYFIDKGAVLQKEQALTI